MSAKEEKLVEQWDVAGYICSTVQNLAEHNSTYSPKETCSGLPAADAPTAFGSQWSVIHLHSEQTETLRSYHGKRK